MLAYTNASTIIGEDFQDTEDLAGLFSGYDAEKRMYDPVSWAYAGEAQHPASEPIEARTGESYSERQSRTKAAAPPRDETLQHPRCVFQILKRHFARYTPELVEQVCGTPQDIFLRVAEAITANSGRERTTAFCYAVGWTQHTVGVQNIRAAAILQLLLGNVGRPGGGILALRGHATIQGSTDVPTLYNLLPGYLQMPLESQPALDDYIATNQSAGGWWHNLPKYMVSLLKAWYGERATAENEWGYQYLPKLNGAEDYSYYPMFFKMKDGKVGPLRDGRELRRRWPRRARRARGDAQAGLVCRARPIPGRDSGLLEAGRRGPGDGGDGGLLHARRVATGEGRQFTNTQRMLQWHEKAVDPPGEARSETWFMVHLGRRLRELYAGSQEERDQPLLTMTWDYPLEGEMQEPSAQAVAEEISGYRVADGAQVSGFGELRDDGTTACGCWIYSGVVPEKGVNLAARRERDKPGAYTNHSQWGWAWPNNRRILYNRASADPDGQPWSERKRLVWWDREQRKWTGYDTPDFPRDKAPDTPANPDAFGIDAHTGADPFIMNGDGRAWLYAPSGLKDGPLPAHYEPFESPVANALYPEWQNNPCVVTFERRDNPMHGRENPRYPYIITTYRLTEHHTSGAMSRWNSWLSELQPALFCEIDARLAQEKGVANGDWVTITTSRSSIEARALVTDRVQPLRIGKRQVHVIGLPYHFGPSGLVTGDVANDLIGVALDPNVRIHEAKAFTCDLRKGRKSDQRPEAETPR